MKLLYIFIPFIISSCINDDRDTYYERSSTTFYKTGVKYRENSPRFVEGRTGTHITYGE